MEENLVEISGRSQLYDLAESSPNALKSDKSTNENRDVNIMCLILLRFCDIMEVIAFFRKCAVGLLSKIGRKNMKIIQFESRCRDDLIFMILEAKTPSAEYRA